VNALCQKVRALTSALSAVRRKVHRFATQSEIKQVQAAAWATAGVGLLSALTVHGAWPKLLLAGPLVGIAIALLLALVHTADFRERRLRSGHCGYPLCHGVVQRSTHVPDDHVICPTCKRVWPTAEGMVFLFSQRESRPGPGRVEWPQ